MGCGLQPIFSQGIHRDVLTTLNEKIDSMQDREQRLNDYKPVGIETIHKPESQLVSFESGLILFECKKSDAKKRKQMFAPELELERSEGGQSEEESSMASEERDIDYEDEVSDEEYTDEGGDHEDESDDDGSESYHNQSFNERKIFAGPPGQALQETLAFSTDAEHYKEMTDGWEVYRIKGAGSDKDAMSRGAVQNQGLWMWKTDLGRDYHFIAMCAEDNVVAVV